jgi:hypothetical protein
MLTICYQEKLTSSRLDQSESVELENSLVYLDSQHSHAQKPLRRQPLEYKARALSMLMCHGTKINQQMTRAEQQSIKFSLKTKMARKLCHSQITAMELTKMSHRQGLAQSL